MKKILYIIKIFTSNKKVNIIIIDFSIFFLSHRYIQKQGRGIF